MSRPILFYAKGITTMAALNGIYLNRRTVCRKLIGTTLFLVFSMFSFVFRKSLTDFTEKRLEILTTVYFYTQPLLCFIQASVFFAKSGVILNNLTKVLRDLELADRQRIRKVSFRLLSIWFAVNLSVSLTKVYFIVRRAALEGIDLMKYDAMYIVIVFLVTASMMSNYIDFGCFLLLFHVYCGHVLTMNCFLKIKWNGFQLQDRGFTRKMLIQLKRRQSQKQSIQDSLAILPVLWFLDFFLAGSAMAIISRTFASHTTILVTQLLPVLENVILVTISVSIMDTLREKELTKVREAVDAIVHNVGKFTNEHMALMKELANYDTKIEAYGLFTINKSFLLSFLGSVVSFSVLLIEITT
ncbi:hypothetical protein HDE_14590 [Halotydeus destructor]|nr:hypothetical protein HDE_14590 [Halotydeus destructor]